MTKPWEHYAQLPTPQGPDFGGHRNELTGPSQPEPSPPSIAPQLPYDLPVLAAALPGRAAALPQLPYDLPALAGAALRAPNAPALGADNSCTLRPPTGNYRAPGAVPLFQPRMADAVSAGIRALNDAHIVPIMTDGYRTAGMQERRRADNRTGRLHNGAAQGISGHQVGLSVDFGPNRNRGNNAAIRDAMTRAGLANGAHFSRPDPLHYMMPNTIRNQTAALARACAAAYRGR